MALNPTKLGIFAVSFLLVWWGLSTFIGIAGGLMITASATVMVLLFADMFLNFKTIPFPLPARMKMVLLVVTVGITLIGGGYWAGISASLTGTGATVSVPLIGPTDSLTCVQSVPSQIKGKAAELVVNAWDLESNTPYSAAIDLTDNCSVYVNGNTAAHFLNATGDTSGGTVPGLVVGDVVYMYCGGRAYYTDPVEGLCVDAERKRVNLESHAIATEANMQIVAYDDGGSAALSAGANGTDYYITMGANADESVFVKLKVNVANKAYKFGGWGTFTFYNMSKVEPQTEEGTYTKIASPEHMSNIQVEENSTSGGYTQTGDYAVYRITTPILMQEWDKIKEQFVVTSDTTNDPLGEGPHTGTTENELNGIAIIAKDIQYDRGGDGLMYNDLYTHDTSEGDVGLNENDVSPAGKTTGVVIAVR